MNVVRIITATAIVALTSSAGWADCTSSCPDCGAKACRAVPVTNTVKKHCYCVECKDICIPKFRWPWEMCKSKGCGAHGCSDSNCTGCADGGCLNGHGSKCGGHHCKRSQCGEVRTINVLVKKEYECKECGCEWHIYCVGNGCADGCCTSGGAGHGGEVAPTPEDAEIPEPPAVEAHYIPKNSGRSYRELPPGLVLPKVSIN